MANNLTMADLLAKMESKVLSLSRGQQIEGTIIAILPQEIILDLGTKSEGVIQKKDLTPDQLANLKVGDKLTSTVIYPENDSGQVVLSPQKIIGKGQSGIKFAKFESAKNNNQVLVGKALEVNKGGLIVEVNGIRGFLPASQVGLAHAANLDDLVGKEIQVTVIEVDYQQNRLIFSQKTEVSEDTKEKLSSLKEGETVSGEVAAILPFGIFVSLPDKVEGLVHISEMSWEKIEDPSSLFNIGDKVSAKIISTDSITGRVNLSIKQLSQDPFSEKAKDISAEDVVKGTITKITPMGVFIDLGDGLEGLIHSSKMEGDVEYKVGDSGNFLVDSVDSQKRRINLVPFVTTTKGLIYK